MKMFAQLWSKKKKNAEKNQWIDICLAVHRYVSTKPAKSMQYHFCWQSYTNRWKLRRKLKMCVFEIHRQMKWKQKKKLGQIERTSIYFLFLLKASVEYVFEHHPKKKPLNIYEKQENEISTNVCNKSNIHKTCNETNGKDTTR